MKSKLQITGKAFAALPVLVLLSPLACQGIGQARYVETTASEGSFAIVQAGETANLYVDSSDHAGVVRVVNDLQADIKRVTDRTAAVTHDKSSPGKRAIIVGTVGKSGLVDQLVSSGKIDLTPIAGKCCPATVAGR